MVQIHDPHDIDLVLKDGKEMPCNDPPRNFLSMFFSCMNLKEWKRNIFLKKIRTSCAVHVR